MIKSAAIHFVLALAVLFLCGETGWARGHENVGERPLESVQAHARAPLAAQLDALLTTRFSLAERLSDAAVRRAALRDLSAFATATADGLVNAAPSGEMRSMIRDEVMPVLGWHQQTIAEAIAALSEPPDTVHRSPSAGAGGPLAEP